jgi:hypothetical protein
MRGSRLANAKSVDDVNDVVGRKTSVGHDDRTSSRAAV